MNWFEILKNVGIKQTQRQGISARQKDEDFIFEDEDEGDCYDEFAAMTERVMASFPNASILQQYTGNRGEHAEYAYDDFYIRVDYNLEEKGKIPDEIYCAAIELFKSSREIPYSAGGPVRNREIIGDYHIGAIKETDFYIIMITEKQNADIDHVLSLMQVSLIDMRDEGYSLHKEFDNWRGLF
tara:strand:+ start:119 stop:667 length:549 start_codon:yes stop_codon:yes gene_type:complete